LVLQIKEKRQFYGTNQMGNQFIMQLYGKIEEQKIFVMNLKKEIKKKKLEKKQAYF
jgi:hypothetical protein